MKKTKIYLLVASILVIFYLAIDFVFKEQKEAPKQQQLALPVPDIKAQLEAYSAYNQKLKQKPFQNP